MLIRTEIIGVEGRHPLGPTDSKYGIRNHAKREYLLVVEITVAGQDVLLELLLVRVPELGGLGI